MAKASEARILANQRWTEKAYDRKVITFPKGTLEQIKSLAAAEGVSVNRYVLMALEVKTGLKLTLDGEFPLKK